MRQKLNSSTHWLPALIVAMTLVAILIGAFALHYVEMSLVDAAGKSLTLAAVDVADKVDILMGERYGDIKLFSGSVEFQGHDLEAMGRKVFDLLESYPVYRWVGVTDGNGLVLVATDGTSKGRDLSGDLGFLAVRERQRIVVQDAALDGEGVPGVTFLSPIHDAKGAFIGAVITQVGLPTLEDAFVHSLSALQVQWGTGAHIEYQFLDHDGNVFVDSFLREEGRINLKRQGVLSAQLFDTAPAGFIEERHARRDVDVVTGYAQTKGTEDLKGLGWGVLLRVDRSDILASTETILWKVGAAGSAIFLPLIGVLFWSIIRLTRSWKMADEERARAQASESKFHTLLELAPDAIVMTDVQGTIVLTNRQLDLVFGYPPGQLIGQSIDVLVPESVRDIHRAHRARFHESPQTRPMGVRHLTGRREDGTEFPIDTSLSYAETADGSFAMAAVRDMSIHIMEETERERLSRDIRLLLDSTLGGLYGIDTQGCCTFINRAGAELLGYPPDELFGKNMHLLIHHSCKDGSPYPVEECTIYRACLAGQGGLIDDEVLWRRDGTFFPSEIASRPIYENGALKGAVVTFSDITERKQAETERRLREADLQRFKTTLDQTHDCVFMFAPDTLRFIYCNRGAVEQVGYSEAELCAMTPLDIKPEFTEPSFREMLQPLRDGSRASHVFETVHRHKDGRAVAVEVSLQLVREQGGEGRFVAVVRDITERKQIEEEIKIRANWQKAVLDYAGYAIIATMPDGVIQTFNRAAERMLGYKAEEVIGKVTPAVIHDPQEVEERAKTFSMELGERIEPGFEVFVAKTRRDLPNEYEWTYIRKDGTRFPVLLSVTALKGSSGGITGFLGLALDITDRKQSEAALKSYAHELELTNQSLDIALDQAKAATKAKSGFLATMSHEIRTPMNGVIGMTGLLLDTDLTSEQREFAEIVRSSGEHLLTIVNDILDFSKIEAGKMSLEVIDFDLRTAVDESVNLLAERASSKGLNLACLFQADVPAALRGDPGRLRQILINLVGNAIKFTEQGEVVISITLAHQTETEATVRFAVQDTGIGLSLDSQRCLFQSFSQADNSTTRKYGGTGLGLAISKQLTELMGGQIGVESRLGDGSTFWFTAQFGLQPQATASPGNVAFQDLHGLQLCIVADHSTNRRILECYAERWGVQCLLAEDGQEMLARLREAVARGQACDFAIIDMQKPGMNGLELARAINRDPSLSPTRLVLLTPQGARGDAAAAQAAGYAAYLTKPVREAQLFACLTTLLTRSAQATVCEGSSAGRPELVTRHSLAEAKAQTTARILVAEDNTVNQKVAVRMLEKLGYRVDLVANGLEALEALTRIPYDVVLMDCNMPEMDGFAATEEIRRREASGCVSSSMFQVSGSKGEDSVRQPETRCRIPVIAMTSNIMQEDRDRCLASGMDDYLSKPIQPKVLAEVVARWVGAPASISGSTGDHPLRVASGGTAC